MNETRPDNPDVITIPPIIYLVGLLLGFLIHYLYPVGFLSQSASIWFGVLLILLSIPIALLAVLGLRRAETSLDVRKSTTAIVTNGVYRFSRNPMYVSLALLYCGIACWANSLWTLLLIVLVLAVVDQGVIKREERYLEQKFGGEYLQYKSEVRRWV